YRLRLYKLLKLRILRRHKSVSTYIMITNVRDKRNKPSKAGLPVAAFDAGATKLDRARFSRFRTNNNDAGSHMKTFELPQGLDVLGPVNDEQTEILSPAALEFFVELQREFNPRRL